MVMPHGAQELGLVMAEEAFRTGLTDKLTFASTVWALLLATLVSPLVFQKLVAHSSSGGGSGGQAPAEERNTAAP